MNATHKDFATYPSSDIDNENIADLNTDVVISFADTLLQQADFAQIEQCYQTTTIAKILTATLLFLNTQYLQNQYLKNPPASSELPHQLNQLANALFDKTVELEIYVTEPEEARAINLEARGKDYATNILSYGSDLPQSVIELLPSLPLGELIICHDVVVRQAAEQGKSVAHHLSHLLVHGILHLIGFDHELGQAEQDEMESIEIAVLASLAIANPYE